MNILDIFKRKPNMVIVPDYLYDGESAFTIMSWQSLRTLFPNMTDRELKEKIEQDQDRCSRNRRELNRLLLEHAMQ